MAEKTGMDVETKLGLAKRAQEMVVAPRKKITRPEREENLAVQPEVQPAVDRLSVQECSSIGSLLVTGWER